MTGVADSNGDSAAAKPGRGDWRHGLSFRLFAITIAAILIVETLIFVPSAAAFRKDWLEQRTQTARVAALALEAAPSRDVSKQLASDLLMTADLLSVAELEDHMRFQLLAPQKEITGEKHRVDLRRSHPLGSMWRTLNALFAPEGRILIIHDQGSRPGRVIEVVVEETPLKKELAAYALRIILLSLIVSLAAGGLIYLLLLFSVVRPVRGLTGSIMRFQRDPGGWTTRLGVTARRDEIGQAQNALADMERVVSDSFRQRQRLAELGEAVAKINHDLRNSLATAQLVSDSLSRSEDPRVQKALPRMERALERAIGLASNTLQYGKAETPPAQLQTVALKAALAEAAAEALAPFPDTACDIAVPEAAQVKADPDHLHRIAANLMRNAAQAMNGGGALALRFEEGALTIADTGPGLPQTVRDNLFKPFSSSRKDGTGLGLVIARDLARAMGGDLNLETTGPDSTAFALKFSG